MPFRIRYQSALTSARPRTEIIPSPLDDFGEELRNEILVIRLDVLDADGLVALAVEVVWVERAHRLKRAHVVRVCQVGIRALAMPRVEGVVADHVQSFGGKRALLLENVVEVLRG